MIISTAAKSSTQSQETHFKRVVDLLGSPESATTAPTITSLMMLTAISATQVEDCFTAHRVTPPDHVIEQIASELAARFFTAIQDDANCSVSDWIEEQLSDEPHPSLSDAERNRRLR